MMFNSSNILPVLLLITSNVTIGCALRLIMFDVPSPGMYGESVELTCSYDLQKDRLYSIKWYKNDVEFYRYVPKDWPPGQFLPMPGIRVDLSRSTKNSVYLQHIDLNSAGIYRCEVSAEAPSFDTAEIEKEMKVYMLPTEGPRITGGRSKYKVGDIVSVNCTSAKSKPAATLHWYINDIEVTSEYETIYSTTLYQDGLEASSLSLKFKANDSHFKNGNMRLKCTASISRIYSMSNEAFSSNDGYNQQSSGLTISENLSQVRNNGCQRLHNYNHCWSRLVIIIYFAVAFVYFEQCFAANS